MSDDRDLETRLRRHLAGEADELPYVVEAEMVHRRLADQRRRFPFVLIPAAAAVVLIVAVGGALLVDAVGTKPAGPAQWGPLAVVPSTGGDQALTTGVLQISDQCVLLRGGDGELELLVWPADRTIWDSVRGTIGFTNSDGSPFTLRDGAVVNLGGGGDSAAESGVSGSEWAESVDWVAAPDPTCPMEVRWYVGDVVSAPPEFNVELPTGTFVTEQPLDGICLALTIETPDDDLIATQWWTVGASGDCATRTSDIATTTADFTQPPGLYVGIPLMEGGTRDLGLRITGTDADSFRFARAGEHERAFQQVEAVSPTFAPVP